MGRRDCTRRTRYGYRSYSGATSSSAATILKCAGLTKPKWRHPRFVFHLRCSKWQAFPFYRTKRAMPESVFCLEFCDQEMRPGTDEVLNYIAASTARKMRILSISQIRIRQPSSAQSNALTHTATISYYVAYWAILCLNMRGQINIEREPCHAAMIATHARPLFLKWTIARKRKVQRPLFA